MQRGVWLGITLKNFVTSFKTVSTIASCNMHVCSNGTRFNTEQAVSVYLCRSQDVVSHISIVKTDP